MHQEEYDTHDPKGHCLPVMPFLMKRTKVFEIVAARDIVFALAHSGVCAAFSRGENKLAIDNSLMSIRMKNMLVDEYIGCSKPWNVFVMDTDGMFLYSFPSTK